MSLKQCDFIDVFENRALQEENNYQADLIAYIQEIYSSYYTFPIEVHTNNADATVTADVSYQKGVLDGD